MTDDLEIINSFRRVLASIKTFQKTTNWIVGKDDLNPHEKYVLLVTMMDHFFRNVADDIDPMCKEMQKDVEND